MLVGMLLLLGGCGGSSTTDLGNCTTYVLGGFRRVAEERTERFLGKVQKDTARCRGGDKAVAWRHTPWIDWQSYWATGDAGSQAPGSSHEASHLSLDGRGIDGALLDLEYQRVELIKFNLFDNSGTYEQYIRGRNGTPGPALKV